MCVYIHKVRHHQFAIHVCVHFIETDVLIHKLLYIWLFVYERHSGAFYTVAEETGPAINKRHRVINMAWQLHARAHCFLLSLTLILTEQDIDDRGRCNKFDRCRDGCGQCWTQRLVSVKIALVTAEVVVNAEADLVWELFGGTVRGDSWPGCSAFLALSKTFTRKFHARFEGVTASYSVLSQYHQLGAKLISTCVDRFFPNMSHFKTEDLLLCKPEGFWFLFAPDLRISAYRVWSDLAVFPPGLKQQKF